MNQTTITRSPEAQGQPEAIALLPWPRFFSSPYLPARGDSTPGLPRKAKFHVLHVKRTFLK